MAGVLERGRAVVEGVVVVYEDGHGRSVPRCLCLHIQVRP
jgi:hypothetical protein